MGRSDIKCACAQGADRGFHPEHFNENQNGDGKGDDSMNKNDDKADQENKQQFQSR